MKETKKFDNWIGILSISIIAIVAVVFIATTSGVHLAKGTYGAESCTCPNGGTADCANMTCTVTCQEGMTAQTCGNYKNSSYWKLVSSQQYDTGYRYTYQGAATAVAGKCSTNGGYDTKDSCQTTTKRKCTTGTGSYVTCYYPTKVGVSCTFETESACNATWPSNKCEYSESDGCYHKTSQLKEGTDCWLNNTTKGHIDSSGNCVSNSTLICSALSGQTCTDKNGNTGKMGALCDCLSTDTSSTTKTCVVGEPYKSQATGYYANVTFSGMTIAECCASKGWGTIGGKCYTDGGITKVNSVEYVYHDPIDGKCTDGYKKVSVAVGTGRKTVCVEERCNCDGDNCKDITIITTPTNPSDSTPSNSNTTYACYLVSHKYVWSSTKPTGGTLVSSKTTSSSCSGCESGYAANSANNCVKPNTNTNPQTGTTAIVLAWIIGIMAIGYSFWYFRRTNTNQ